MPIHLIHNGPIATVILNAPERRNALTQAGWQEIADCFSHLANQDHLRAVILTGAGDHFCVGADIREFDVVYTTRDSTNAYFDAVKAATDAIAVCPVPTIAAIKGQAFGGGVALTLACDLRFADDTVQMAITPAKLGLVYPFGDLKRLVDLIGTAKTKDLMFSARALDAKQALSLGLIDRLCADVHSEALTYAENMVANAPSSLRVLKLMIGRITAGQTAEDADMRALLLNAVESTDFAEGKAAFAEKRKPVFERNAQ